MEACSIKKDTRDSNSKRLPYVSCALTKRPKTPTSDNDGKYGGIEVRQLFELGHFGSGEAVERCRELAETE